jgi:hypothetical protein
MTLEDGGKTNGPSSRRYRLICSATCLSAREIETRPSTASSVKSPTYGNNSRNQQRYPMGLLKNKPTLEDQIRATQAAAEAWLDERAAALGKENQGLPVTVIRNLLTARSPSCPCAAVLRLEE